MKSNILGVAATVITLASAAAAKADTIYTYTGNAFTDFSLTYQPVANLPPTPHLIH
jgi:hypothetical protein